MPAISWPHWAVVVFVALGTSAHSFGADVTYDIDRSISMSRIDVVGEIDRQTPAQIAAAIRKIREASTGIIFLRLDSGGGDVEAAIASGVLAREHEMRTIVRQDASCASACALTFLGGVVRIVEGRYGIHRPYAIRHTNSNADARREYEAINKMTKAYLEQMNIAPRVLEAMNVESPGDVRWLTGVELKEMRIFGSDPIWENRTDSAYAKRLGISKRELYSRQQRANSVCLISRMSTNEYARCRIDVVEGRRK